MKVIQSASLINDIIKSNISLDILTNTNSYKIALHSWDIQLTLEKLRNEQKRTNKVMN